MTIVHSKKYFYKYVTAETALLILRDHKIKYSSPVIFNDPFDTQTRIGFSFDESEAAKAFTQELYRLIHDEKEPSLDPTSRVARQVSLMRQVRKESGRKMSRDVWMEMAKDIIELQTEQLSKLVDETNAMWSKAVRAFRVFCVVEEHENLLMWAHYAQNHTGAVIQFECLEELDTPLCAARKVRYLRTPPVIAEDVDDYIRGVTGELEPANYESLFFDLCLSKSEHWKYEREWRVFIPPDLLNPIIPKDAYGNEVLFDLKPFHPQEIHSIYFGCKMSEDNRQKIETFLTGDFGHVKKYKCIRSEKKYKLDFVELTR